MLFKQWNEIAEPRHQLDVPTIFQEKGSLREVPLPKVCINCPDLSNYNKVILTTNVMNPLFPGNLLRLENVGEISATLTINQEHIKKNLTHSWDFEVNFPNEVDPEGTVEDTHNVYTFNTPITAFEDTLLISLRENSLELSPVFLNQISNELVKFIITKNPHVSILVLGTSDHIAGMKEVSDKTCSLRPPEFITGFIGAVITQLVVKSFKFEGYIAPSEGPVGFEKMSLETVENLVEVSTKWVPEGTLLYADECYRHWRLDGCVSGAQSGLYI